MILNSFDVAMNQAISLFLLIDAIFRMIIALFYFVCNHRRACIAVCAIPRYFFTVFYVGEIVSTTHHYLLVYPCQIYVLHKNKLRQN